MEIYLASRIEGGMVTSPVIGNHQMKLPDGCMGISLIFDSTEALKKYYSDEINIINLKLEGSEPNLIRTSLID